MEWSMLQSGNDADPEQEQSTSMKKSRRKQHAAPPGFTRLVFVCDTKGRVSFWQDPVTAKPAKKSSQ
jgi:hypothetical protein